jgi:hypothetical protein
MRVISLILLFFSFSNVSYAAIHHAESWYFLWGYNRSNYKDSDINFKGPGYDYTLEGVRASDKQSAFQWEWLTPWGSTIPQTNTRFGYYLDEEHRIYFGVDHMKYVMVSDQVVSKTGTDQNGNSNATQTINPAFLTYEHTDGLNYVNVGYEMLHPFWTNNSIRLSTLHGPDIGFVYPKTNASMQGKTAHDEFAVAGYGASYKIGLVADIGPNWFVQFEGKRGRLIMPHIRPAEGNEDSASQTIDFFEYILALGYVF